MAARPSLKTVAHAARVSIATASLALRHDRRIAAQTRARVQAAAEATGYRPDPTLAALAARRFHRDKDLAGSAMLFVTAHPMGWAFSEVRFLDACRQRAEALGYRFEHVEAGDPESWPTLERTWFYRGVRALIFGNSLHNQRLLDAPWPRFAVVCCGGYFQQPAYHTVKADAARAVFRLWEEGWRRGYRRIGFAMLRHGQPIFDDILRAGVARELAARARPLVPPLFSPIEERAPFLAWHRKHRPDLVIAFPPIAHDWLKDAGVRVPRDAGLMVLPFEAPAKVSGWDEDNPAISAAAVELADHLVRHGDTGRPSTPRIIEVPGSFKDLGTAPIKASR